MYYQCRWSVFSWLFMKSLFMFSNSFIKNCTTVIVKIKGKPRSLFCNTHTVIWKLLYTIIFNENKSVELICKNKDVLVNFTLWI
jgi:hypothetical protein